MRTIETTVYQFHELSEDAQERAIRCIRDKYDQRDHFDYLRYEAGQSRSEFLAHFGFKETHGSLGTSGAHYKGRYSEETDQLFHVRAWKWITNNILADSPDLLSGNCPFTGVCYDEILLDPMREFMKRPYKIELSELISDCLANLDRAIESEIDYRYSDEAIIEDIECNDFEFTEEGELI